MKPFKETKLGKWLKEKAPKVLDTVGDVLPDKGVLGIIKNLIDKEPDIPAEDRLEFEKLVQDHEREMYSLEVNDRINARDMFKANSELQKVYAITFLIGYLLLTLGGGILIYITAYHKVHVAEWAIGLISSIWGALSMKVSTINDFLFGSSYRKDENK